MDLAAQTCELYNSVYPLEINIQYFAS